MHDQAHRLRQIIAAREAGASATRVVTIASGKGGVGKSNCALNLAIGLIRAGKRVIILDADIGFANIDVLLGLSVRRSLVDLYDCKTSIWDVLQEGPEGLQFIAGGTGLKDLLSLDENQLQYVIHQLQKLQGAADFILIDTGAGLNAQTLRLILSSDEVLVVTTPEPTALTDAYALIKLVANRTREIPLRLLVNRVSSPVEGKQTAEKIGLVAQRFLQLNLVHLGSILEDPMVAKAVKRQVPFLSLSPHSPASRSMQQVALRFLDINSENDQGHKGIRRFLQRMVSYFRSS